MKGLPRLRSTQTACVSKECALCRLRVTLKQPLTGIEKKSSGIINYNRLFLLVKTVIT